VIKDHVLLLMCETYVTLSELTFHRRRYTMKLEIMKQYPILFTDARVVTSEGVLTRGWLLTDGRIIKGFG